MTEVAELLAADSADEVARCRSLLAWFGAGSGRCSGYPAHEDIPGRLSLVPIDTVLAALHGEPTDNAVWAGALRHLADWGSRSDEELE